MSMEIYIYNTRLRLLAVRLYIDHVGGIRGETFSFFFFIRRRKHEKDNENPFFRLKKKKVAY